jgi:SWIM zinc finger
MAKSRPDTCRLTLTINGVDYAVRRLPSPAPRWSLRRDGGTRYTVTRTADGTVTCDCPDFAFRHGSGDNGCKHARAVVAAGLIETSPSGPGGRQAGGGVLGGEPSREMSATPRLNDERPSYVPKRGRPEPRMISEEGKRILLGRASTSERTDA